MQPFLTIRKADPPHPDGLPWEIRSTQPGYFLRDFEATFGDAVIVADRFLIENGLRAPRHRKGTR